MSDKDKPLILRWRGESIKDPGEKFAWFMDHDVNNIKWVPGDMKPVEDISLYPGLEEEE